MWQPDRARHQELSPAYAPAPRRPSCRLSALRRRRLPLPLQIGERLVAAGVISAVVPRHEQVRKLRILLCAEQR